MRSKTQFSGVRRASRPVFVNVCTMHFPFCEIVLLGPYEAESPKSRLKQKALSWHPPSRGAIFQLIDPLSDMERTIFELDGSAVTAAGVDGGLSGGGLRAGS